MTHSSKDSMDTSAKITLRWSGAGRGAAKAQPTLAELNRQQDRIRFSPIYVDPDPGKATKLAHEGRGLGFQAAALEERGETALRNLEQGDLSPIVVTIDDAQGIAEHLESGHEGSMLLYSILDAPGLGIVGLMCVFTAENRGEKSRFANFFRELHQVVARGGTADVFGPEGPTPNNVSEDRLRARFSKHFARNILKIVHGLQPESPTAEVIVNARDVRKVVLLEKKEEARSDEEILSDLDGSLDSAVRPGTRFVVVELVQGSIRFHQVGLRVVDRQLALTSARHLGLGRLQKSEEQAAATPVAVLDRFNAGLLAD